MINLQKLLRAAEIDFNELQDEYNRNLEQIQEIRRKNAVLDTEGHKLKGRIELLTQLISMQEHPKEEEAVQDYQFYIPSN